MRSKKRNILFTPSRPYRSDPSFIQLCAGLREHGYYLIYIDFNGFTHQFHAAIDEQERKKELLTHFDEVMLLDGRKYALKSFDTKPLTWSKLRNKARVIKQTMKEVNPLAIIISFNQGLEFNTIVRYVKSKPLFFLQTVAIGSEIKEAKGVHPFRRMVYNLFDINIYPPQKNNFHQLLWANKLNTTKNKAETSNTFYLGNPLFDSILKNSSKPELNSWKSCSIGYLTQPNYNTDKESKILLNSFFEYFVKDKSYSLKVLVHPRDSVPFFNAEFSQYQPDVRYSSQFSDSELTNTICITYSSVYAQELVAKGVPVIIINPKRKNDYTAIFSKDYPFVLSAKQDLDKMWMEINNGEFYQSFWSTRENFIKEVNTFTDGNSTQRVVEKIVDIVS